MGTCLLSKISWLPISHFLNWLLGGYVHTYLSMHYAQKFSLQIFYLPYTDR